MSLLRRQHPVDASEVMPGLLVGSAPDASQAAELTRRGVTVVVDLRAEVANEVIGQQCLIQNHRSHLKSQ